MFPLWTRVFFEHDRIDRVCEVRPGNFYQHNISD